MLVYQRVVGEKWTKDLTLRPNCTRALNEAWAADPVASVLAEETASGRIVNASLERFVEKCGNMMQLWPLTVANGIIIPINKAWLYIIISPFITVEGHNCGVKGFHWAYCNLLFGNQHAPYPAKATLLWAY